MKKDDNDDLKKIIDDDLKSGKAVRFYSAEISKNTENNHAENNKEIKKNR